MASLEPLASLDDDGLPAPEIGAWGEEKYRHVGLYAALFIRSMRSKWDALVYLDLFAGSGRSKIRGTRRIVNVSPLLILGIAEAYDKYIFYEGNRTYAEALQKRCQQEFPDRKVTIIPGDANTSVENIIEEMPRPGRSHKVLGFCFLDPFQMKDLCFSTIEALSKRFMDFLILIPPAMDANRNEQHYLRPRNSTVDKFVGNAEWRVRWEAGKVSGKSFGNFIVEEFGRSMQRLGYLEVDTAETKLVRSRNKNLPLYRLALYSKHPLAKKLWKETKKYTDSQLNIDF